MKNTNYILLPGLDKQIKLLLERVNISGFQILVIGSQSVQIAKRLSNKHHNRINLIVEDYESLMGSKFEIENDDKIDLRLMDFERTDFENEQFDLIFAQASISNSRRKNIVKEIKRITKQNGIFCLGEMVKLKSETPTFVKDILEFSELELLLVEDLERYYSDRNFSLMDSADFSSTLKEFYKMNSELLKIKSKKLSDSEKSYYKKLLNQVSHESNAFLKLGADKFIGFKTLLLKKM